MSAKDRIRASKGAKARRKSAAGSLIFETLQKGLAQETLTKFPGTDVEVVLVPLSLAELQRAEAAADQRWREIGRDHTFMSQDSWQAETNLQALAMALRDPEDDSRETRLFESVDELRDSLQTMEQQDALTTELYLLQQQANPNPDSMSQDVFERISQAVKKKDVIRLSSFASSVLATYLLTTAAPPES